MGNFSRSPWGRFSVHLTLLNEQRIRALIAGACIEQRSLRSRSQPLFALFLTGPGHPMERAHFASVN
jgi:recombinational DNA repair protein (RecF pathway)